MNNATAKEQRLIVGMGASGLSLASYWQHSGAEPCNLTAVDDRTNPPKQQEFKQLPQIDLHVGENFRHWQPERYAQYQRIALSPGVAPTDINTTAEKLTNDADCFSRAWRQWAPATSQLWAVTGTNGKSTVTALAAHLANSAGITAEAVGNIGEPMLAALLRWQQHGFPQVAVVELSSFQLELAAQFYSDAAVVLNVSDDHLDRHGSLQHYAAIKYSIYAASKRIVANKLMTAPAIAASAAATSYCMSATAPNADVDWTVQAGWICYQGTPRYRLAAMSPACQNYVELVLATLALSESLPLSTAAITAGLASFAGLAHRQQQVGQHAGVCYVDDSKATNVEAALFALLQSKQRVIWLGGGIGKGQDFSPLAQAATQMQAAIVFGADAAAIRNVLAATEVPCYVVENMEQAVQQAQQLATAGDTVLLSPACSSLDMFANYKARGVAFAHAVAAQCGEGGQ